MFSLRVICEQEPSMECMFCYERFKPDSVPSIKTDVDILSSLFNTFSKLMKWESPLEYQFNFGEEHFPFCSLCSTILAHVCELDQQIQTVISNVIATIIECGKQVSKGERTDRGTEKVQFYRRQTIFKHEPSVIPVTHDQPYKSGIELPHDVPEDDDVIITQEVFVDPPSTIRGTPLSTSCPVSSCSSMSTRNPAIPSELNTSAGNSNNREQVNEGESSAAIPETHQQHLKKFPDRSYCTLCSRSFSEVRYLKLHMRGAHAPESSKHFSCKHCSRKFASKHLLGNHMRMHIMPRCQVFGEAVSEQRLSRQVKKHEQGGITSTGAESEQSPTQNEFQSINELSAGLGKAVDEANRSEEEESGTGEDSHAALKNQQNSQVQDSSLICPVCHHYFTQRAKLKIHMLAVHADESSKTFCCQVCDRKYALASLLKRHMTTHNGIPCLLCGEVFLSKAMTEHKKKHCSKITRNSKGEYECEHCHRSFLDGLTLYRHIQQVCGAAAPASSSNSNNSGSDRRGKNLTVYRTY